MTSIELEVGAILAALAIASALALRQWSNSPASHGRGPTSAAAGSSPATPVPGRRALASLLCSIKSSKNEPGWGGLCIDDKGLYWETLSEMARHFGRENDLILLRVRPDGAPAKWQPTHTYNLTSDRSIPYGTFSKAVIDTAFSLGQASDKGFFKNQAQVHIARALEVLREIRAEVTLDNAYHLLINERDLQEALDDLAAGAPTPARRELISHFHTRYLNQPSEQIGGVKETIANYLQAFVTPDIAQVFCPATNTFDFADIDRGKIICVAMPQKFQTERRYVNTFLKMLFYTHALRRFDKPKEERKRDNLIVLWADEAQRFVTASEDGMSDYNCVDIIREAQATIVAAAQSSSSFIPPLGRDKARVFTLNLRNRLIFKAADEEGALESADFIGKAKMIKKSWGYSAGKMSRNYSEQEEHKIKPHLLRNLPKHACVLVHCERGHRRKLLPPLEPDGHVSPWFRRWRFDQ
jgi:hypothetical protein